MNESEIMKYQKKVCEVLEHDYFSSNEGYRIATNPVRKNNSIHLHGINIFTKNSVVSPTFYLESYMEDFTEEATAHQIYLDYQKHRNQALFIEDNKLENRYDFESVKDKICYKVVNRQRNENELQGTAPYIPITNDLIAVFYLQIAPEATCQINNGITDLWCIHQNVEETLFQYAKDNTERLHPASLTSIVDVLSSIAPNDMDMDDFEQDLGIPMYVLTESHKVNGACTLLYGNGTLLEQCMETMKKELMIEAHGLYILPSSVHELLLIPDSNAFELDKNALQEMVKEVNETQLSADEFLSDNVFHFSSDEGIKQITFNEIEIVR